VPALWDARIERPLAEAGIVNGFVINDLGVDGARILVPDDPASSLMHLRLSTATESYKMPPVGKNRVDQAAVSLLEQWIADVTPPSPAPLPAPWQKTDVGSVQLAGDAAYGGGIYTVRGSGDDIWGTQDGFHFVHRELNGDGTMIARILAQSNTDDWAKAGVMIRESLGANSKHVMTVLTPGNGLAFQGREATGGESFHNGGPAGKAPVWLRLQRTGNLFVSAQSDDGTIWSEIGRTTVRMGARVQAGLCVTSHNGGRISTASFDQVYFMPGVPFVFATQPRSVLALAGASASFRATLVGDAPGSLQWLRNGRSVTGANRLTFTIPSVALTDAGAHQLLAGGRLKSNAAALSVVGEAVFNPNIPLSGTATLSVPAAGPGITYVWSKDGQVLDSNSKISGAKTNRLVIRGFTADDAGEYACTASAFGWSEALEPCVLRLLNLPKVTTANPPAALVSSAFLWQLTSDEPATTVVVGGLPRGLSYDARVNRITGVPTESGSFSVTLTPRNAAGTGTSVTFTLSVASLPDGIAGGYSGLIDRHAVVNGELGGAFQLHVSPSGSISGRLKSGTGQHVLRGRLDVAAGVDPTYGITLKRGTRAPLVLNLTFDRNDASVSGKLHAGAAQTGVSGRHAVVEATGTPRSASTLRVTLTTATMGAPDPDLPNGSGSLRVRRLVADGTTTFTVTGRLADGSQLTWASHLWDNGDTPWRQVLYLGRGSLQGRATVTPVSPTLRQIQGSLSWRKLDPAGFDASLTLTGSDAAQVR
jgi:hypothetical protein